jgi:hypothetical protein
VTTAAKAMTAVDTNSLLAGILGFLAHKRTPDHERDPHPNLH